MDQIIRKPIPIYVFELYAPDIAFNMSINFLSYWCSLQYFIYRSIMSDYFSAVEPMDIEGEAVCAVSPQLVTLEGEKGAGVDVKRTSSHLEADNLLTLDNGEPTDDQEQVTASTHNKFAKTASVFMSKLDQLSKLQGKGAMGEPAAEGGVQDVRGGNKSTDNRAIHTNNDVFIEGVRVPGPSLVPYLLAPSPPPCVRSLVLKRVRTIQVVPATPVAPQPSSAQTTMVRSAKGRGEVVNEVPLASASPTFYGDRHCGFAVGGVVAGQASYTAMFNRARECLSCDVEHPEEKHGVLVLGDQYTP